jgi:transposase
VRADAGAVGDGALHRPSFHRALTLQHKRQGADHIRLVVSAPEVGWSTAYTIVAEIGDVHRSGSPATLCGYTGLCPGLVMGPSF